MKSKKTHIHLPLHIVIAAFFTTLIIIFGSILGWYNYKETAELLLDASQEVFNQVNKELSLDYIGTYKPVATAVLIISNTDLVEAETLDERLLYLPMLQATLQEAPHLSGLEVGYPNGDYFIVRPLNFEYMRTRFHAPDMAALVVDNVHTATDGVRYQQRFWYNQSLQELQRTVLEKTAYDPRVRPWYTIARDDKKVHSTDPYLFHFIDQVGFTISYKSLPSGAVVAGDVTLIQLSETLAGHKMTEHSEIVILSEDGFVVAYQDSQMLQKKSNGKEHALPRVEELQSDVLSYAKQTVNFDDQVVDFAFQGERWLGGIRELDNLLESSGYYLAMLSPEKELMAEAIRIQMRGALIILVLIIITGPISLVMARLIATPLRRLAVRAKRISNFDFSLQDAEGSTVIEVDELSKVMSLMQTTISQFTLLINSLASEQDFDALLATITSESLHICKADAAVTYLVNEAGNQLVPGTIYDRQGSCQECEGVKAISLSKQSAMAKVLRTGNLEIRTVDADESGEFAPVFSNISAPSMDVFMLPLRNRQKEGVGVLCICYGRTDEQNVSIEKDQVAFAEAISGFAAVTLESRKMLKMQKQLLDSFIVLLAGAIDAKSPYTGGHCQRVPVLTKLLAQKACECSVGTFADFTMDAEQWEALHIATWLHDCGKVTTPEYVVDKATKLETIYDRIHEIRMRFEVLKRDAHIEYWEQVHAGGNKELLYQNLEEQWQVLDKEFAFVAGCNLGGEFFANEDKERLQKIAGRKWQRTIDDRIGISWEELQRKERTKASLLPVTEYLLADKEEHIVERTKNQKICKEDDCGFVVKTPKYLYNRGELYNLSVKRGTLTNEERYKINDHIVQTIIMLKKLPYPKHLQDVPDIAGGHHEKMDGTGYPRQLDSSQLSVPAKMMAIADIFEALTASDRPYKKAKKLSEVIQIMSTMEQEKHIDSNLFKLFLASGAYKEYADKYLLPEQIDSVDLQKYVKIGNA